MSTKMLTQLDNDRIALMRAFVESARRLNFAAAARELNLTPSALGRRIQRLEAHLGVALFVRSTRRVALTDAGALYWRQSEEILSAIAAADAMAISLGDRPTGLLRISAPASFGRLYLSRALPSFLRGNPALQVDLMYGDQNVDLIGGRVDVAIRIGRLEDSGLVARRLARNVRRLVAAPDYLASASALRVPQDLRAQRTLHFSYLRGGEAWTLQREEEVVRVPLVPALRCNDALALYEAALAGQGVALLADFITRDSLHDGRLVPVLGDWQVPETGIYAVYPASDFVPSKIRVFVDFLVSAFSREAAFAPPQFSSTGSA